MSDGLPSGWECATVGEIANVKRGASPRPIQDPLWWGGNVGWVRISDVTSSRKYLTKTTQYLSEAGVSKSVKIEKGEVVLSICATIGRPIIIKVDACIHDGFVWFDNLRGNIDREFWYYFLLSKEEFLSSQRQSGTQGNLNTGIVSDLICFIPPLPEQQKIAAVLTAVDDVIESTQAQINKLSDLKAGLMQELLTKGIGHTEFKESPVGRIPKTWTVCAVGEIAEVVDPQPDHRTPAEVDDGVPYVGLGDIDNDGLIDFANARKVAKDVFDKQINSFNIHEHAFIFGKIGTIGYPSILPKSRFYCLSANVILLTANDPMLMQYLFQVFTSGIVDAQILLHTNTTSQPALGIKKVRDFFVPIPSNRSEMEKLVRCLSSIDSSLNFSKRKLNRIVDTKKALMQDLLTGKVRVNVG